MAASGLAREVLDVVRATGSHDVVGLLDDDAALHGEHVRDVPVLGGLEAVTAHPDAQLVLCAGRGQARDSLAERLAGLGVAEDRYATVRHPSVDVPGSCTVGSGTVLLAHVAVTADVRIGRHVVVMPNATLTHDDVLEDFVTVCANVALGGSVHVGERAYLGMGGTVRERLTVGAGATLGMAAALVTDLPPGQTWLGVPARPQMPSHVGELESSVAGRRRRATSTARGAES
ncbi:NeuD/PglB/VioB family sugar acetyltransferase [Georgenia sp. SUBG003]|uniref:NeuD/PglB/VioB family sugar acetyltransferase n=1 Tax=Georgenia sp. SUBG003 TaxID=1497974 RepID=UPI000B133E88